MMSDERGVPAKRVMVASAAHHSSLLRFKCALVIASRGL